MTVKRNGMNRAEVLMCLVRGLKLTEEEAEKSVARADNELGRWRITERNAARIRNDNGYFSVEEC
jgi:hypothetical protein